MPPGLNAGFQHRHGHESTLRVGWQEAFNLRAGRQEAFNLRAGRQEAFNLRAGRQEAFKWIAWY